MTHSKIYVYAYILKYVMLYLFNEIDILTLPDKKILKKIKPNLCRCSDRVEHQTDSYLKCFYKHILMPNFPAASITVVEKLNTCAASSILRSAGDRLSCCCQVIGCFPLCGLTSPFVCISPVLVSSQASP